VPGRERAHDGSREEEVHAMPAGTGEPTPNAEGKTEKTSAASPEPEHAEVQSAGGTRISESSETEDWQLDD